MRCNYFQLLQSINKELPISEKLVRLNSKGSLMKMKRYLSQYKPDYEIWFWIKSFKNTCSQEYKNEAKLLNEFKKYVNRKKKKVKPDKIKKDLVSNIAKLVDTRLNRIEEYKLQSPEYHPESPIYIPKSPST
ncbi:6887_t:CDS:1 [Cetraspora pellucida]|uniref:6887_t:CDS:1 n=1 Tax=Cetraspora pellucida TaxID=1433469 RepID=A0A9N8VGR5_9GLOM|nr:6887_t:CDS:1 [Cetraspora pellucida]